MTMNPRQHGHNHLCFGILALWLAACASAPQATTGTPRTEGQAQDALLDARRRLALDEAEQAPPITLIEGVELRLNDLDMADLLVRNSALPSGELRTPLQNPWRLKAERDAHRARVEGRLAEIDVEAARAEAEACFQSADLETHRLRTEAWERLRDDLALLQTWADGLLDAQLASEPNHRARSLARQRRLLRAHPGPAPPQPDRAPIALPPLTAQQPALDLRPEVLDQALLAHPIWSSHLAEQALLNSLSARQTSGRLPWLSWISLGYTPRLPNSRPIIEGRLAVEIPLGFEQRAEAEALKLRAAEARLDAQAQRRSRLSALEAALSQRAAFDAEIPALLALQTTAREHRALALGWIAARAVDPSEAESLIMDAFELEDALIDARSRAGESSCAVFALTGVHPSEWPRR